MTYEQLLAAIESTINSSLGLVKGGSANVPIWTGRLRSAIKVKKEGDNFVIFIEPGALSEEEWNDVYGGINIDNAPWGVAPYAATVNNKNPYWERVWLLLYQRLRVELVGLNTPISYHPTGRGD